MACWYECVGDTVLARRKFTRMYKSKKHCWTVGDEEEAELLIYV